jgi:hypothetical protein
VAEAGAVARGGDDTEGGGGELRGPGGSGAHREHEGLVGDGLGASPASESGRGRPFLRVRVRSGGGAREHGEGGEWGLGFQGAATSFCRSPGAAGRILAGQAIGRPAALQRAAWRRGEDDGFANTPLGEVWAGVGLLVGLLGPCLGCGQRGKEGKEMGCAQGRERSGFSPFPFSSFIFSFQN